VIIRSSCISKPQSQSIAVVTSLAAGTGLEPFAPLEVSAYRWIPMRLSKKSVALREDSPELVERKVKALLNKLTMKKFDSISGQIIVWANKSEKDKDGRTLIQVIKLVFETAIDQPTWSEMYARLCRKMMEQISPKVRDDGIRNSEGKHITGGHLFRKYLLNRCQEDFERGWDVPQGSENQPAFYSDEYYAFQKAKRQGLGVIRFMGELFKLQMLTERIMHESVKKLFGSVSNPREEGLEGLCQLLSTVGSRLDTRKARAHMDTYFSRMKELVKSPNVKLRIQFLLQVNIFS
jgi:translation initiation factor 4G